MRHRLEYAAVVIVRRVLGVLPHGFARGLGAFVGSAVYTFDRGHRRVALANLERAFPSRRADERRAIAREMFRHFGRLLFEMLKFSTLSEAEMRDRVEFEGEDRARLAYAQGRGVLFFTGHFGVWELHAIVHGLQLHPIGVLARALDNPYLNRLLEDLRSRTGNTVIYRQGAVRRVLKALGAGEGVAMLIDQHMHSPDAVEVDFFDRPAATTSTLAALALRTGAPVVPVFALPLPGGRYRMIYEHAVEAPDPASPDAIRELTQRCTDVLEMYVRRHPELWLWMHRRWRTRGAMGAPGAPGPPSRPEAAPARSRRSSRDGSLRAEADATGAVRFAGATGGTGAPGPVELGSSERFGPDSRKPTAVSQGPNRLVIFAPNWLGDAVMALPAIADLGRAWPETHVAVAARGAVAALFELVPGVGEIVRLESHPRRGPAAWRRDTERLAAGNFDAALLLPNSFASAWLASRARIPERWGYARDLRGRLLTRPIPRLRSYGHQAEYYQALVATLGVETGQPFARLAVDGTLRERAGEMLRQSGLEDGRRFVVLAPGAAYGRAKQWLPERFAELAALLAADDLVPVLVGTKADTQVCAEIAGRFSSNGSGPHAGSAIVNLAGRTDLPTLAALMASAEATVSNDSGAMHLAGAVGSRVVAVFGPTNAGKTAPLRASAEAPAPVIVATRVWCRPCMLRECPIDHRCMRRVSARAVFDALGSRPSSSGGAGA